MSMFGIFGIREIVSSDYFVSVVMSPSGWMGEAFKIAGSVFVEVSRGGSTPVEAIDRKSLYQRM